MLKTAGQSQVFQAGDWLRSHPVKMQGALTVSPKPLFLRGFLCHSPVQVMCVTSRAGLEATCSDLYQAAT